MTVDKRRRRRRLRRSQPTTSWSRRSERSVHGLRRDHARSRRLHSRTTCPAAVSIGSMPRRRATRLLCNTALVADGDRLRPRRATDARGKPVFQPAALRPSASRSTTRCRASPSSPVHRPTTRPSVSTSYLSSSRRCRHESRERQARDPVATPGTERWTTRKTNLPPTVSPLKWTPGQADDCTCSFRIVATDEAGNVRISALRTNIKIDNFVRSPLAFQNRPHDHERPAHPDLDGIPVWRRRRLQAGARLRPPAGRRRTARPDGALPTPIRIFPATAPRTASTATSSTPTTAVTTRPSRSSTSSSTRWLRRRPRLPPQAPCQLADRRPHVGRRG